MLGSDAIPQGQPGPGMLQGLAPAVGLRGEQRVLQVRSGAAGCSIPSRSEEILNFPTAGLLGVSNAERGLKRGCQGWVLERGGPCRPGTLRHRAACRLSTDRHADQPQWRERELPLLPQITFDIHLKPGGARRYNVIAAPEPQG